VSPAHLVRGMRLKGPFASNAGVYHAPLAQMIGRNAGGVGSPATEVKRPRIDTTRVG
jgi:hypothetical protein